MAARYVLLEFDDEAQASALCAQINAASRSGKGFRVIGLFARPSSPFCRCGTWTTERGTNSTLKRGGKFGWLVCLTCRRPAPMMDFLRNLIKPEDVINAPTYEVAAKGKRPQQLQFHPVGIGLPTIAPRSQS